MADSVSCSCGNLYAAERRCGSVLYARKKHRKQALSLAVAIALGAILPLAARAAGAAVGDDDAWIAKIRRDHPRMFFNRDTWPAVRDHALSQRRKRSYEQLLRQCDGYPEKPVCSDFGPVDTLPSTPIKSVRDWGAEAAKCAFAWRMTGERSYLEKAKEMLRVSIDAYHAAYRNRRAVNWYSTGRVLALCAYDWIFEALSDDERRAIIVPLLQHVEDVQPGKGKPFVKRLNYGRPPSGWYGTRSLTWYSGLAAYGDGLCDELALKHLKKGYADTLEMLDYRDRSAGDDGGLSVGVPGYSMGAYPWAHFSFFHTWQSATGENVAARYPHLALFMNWIWWYSIPSADPLRLFEYGFGDGQHTQNFLPTGNLYEHATHYAYFFRDVDPDAARLAATLRRHAPNSTIGSGWPIYPYVLSSKLDVKPFTEEELDARQPKARHFEFLGQIFMRSGRRPDSTYCLFTAGAKTTIHKHYDENNFVIYKNDFLALDSGTRAIETDTQLRYYFGQTVAHNCVLVHRPGEPMPVRWGRESKEPEAKVGHGGQVSGAAKVLAFRTNPLFSYVASDAAPVYQGKATAVVRQFVHVQPDYFVVYDRVDAAQPSYRTEWLLHTENEPSIDGMRMRADCGKGRIFCETALPSGAVLSKVGGPGREFWASGKNWEMDPKFRRDAEAHAKKVGVGPYFGKWRLEVSPARAEAKETRFLHVLTAADIARPEPVRTAPAHEAARDGVALEIPDGEMDGKRGTLKVICLFNRTGAVGAEVRCILSDGSGTVLASRRFVLENTIQPQSGVFPAL